MKNSTYLPYCQVSFDNSEIDEVVKCLKSGWLTMGTKVLEFEKNFAKYVGVKYAIAVNSCTAALEIALMAHGITKGDEVLVPSFTFVSTVNVIVRLGATPVFVDIEKSTLNIDPADLEKKITKKTKAVIPVHYAGLPVDLSRISKIAKKNKLIIIEDAAHAVGSQFKRKYVGAHGNSTCFSFYATKTMTTGEGGMLTTNNSKIATYAMRTRLHGISKDAWKRYTKNGTWKYDVLQPGLKCNMTDIQAAMGIHQLNKLNNFIKKRSTYAALYDNGFKNNPHVETLMTPANSLHSRHLYPILLHNINRDKFIEKMTENNIGTSVHFIPVHHFSFYKKHFPVKKNSLRVTDDVFKRIVSLPLYPAMTEQEVARVITTVNALTKSEE